MCIRTYPERQQPLYLMGPILVTRHANMPIKLKQQPLFGCAACANGCRVALGYAYCVVPRAPVTPAGQAVVCTEYGL
jgi:hypothetical protein